MQELHWGLPVIGYLFLAGVGAGAYTVSSSVLLRGGGGGFRGDHFNIARYGALLAPIPLIAGTGMIIFELGTFKAAIEQGDIGLFFQWINLFLTINMSPMSIGSWVLGLCIVASLVYAYTFLVEGSAPGDEKAGLREGLAWVGVPLGISVAIYTGVMLGAMPARPFWNSPVLAFLFLISSLSTGVAGILLVRAMFGTPRAAPTEGLSGSDGKSENRATYLLASSDVMLIGFEALAIFLFIMFAHLTIGNPAYAVSIILPGGGLATIFWVGVVAVGLVLPALIELRYVIPTLLHHQPYAMPRGTEIFVCTLVLLGGFILRYVVVLAGQMTGPVGI
ncbi:MAG: polysulfide reductase NrfD [Rhodospirillales bacterium]|nr:polysulfide reductase NrfD [Rhodospirillales bacterium]